MTTVRYSRCPQLVSHFKAWVKLSLCFVPCVHYCILVSSTIRKPDCTLIFRITKIIWFVCFCYQESCLQCKGLLWNISMASTWCISPPFVSYLEVLWAQLLPQVFPNSVVLSHVMFHPVPIFYMGRYSYDRFHEIEWIITIIPSIYEGICQLQLVACLAQSHLMNPCLLWSIGPVQTNWSEIRIKMQFFFKHCLQNVNLFCSVMNRVNVMSTLSGHIYSDHAALICQVSKVWKWQM